MFVRAQGARDRRKNFHSIFQRKLFEIRLENEPVDNSAYENVPLAELIIDLTSKYNKKIRPVRNFSEPVIANISLKPYQLLDVVNF